MGANGIPDSFDDYTITRVHLASSIFLSFFATVPSPPLLLAGILKMWCPDHWKRRAFSRLEGDSYRRLADHCYSLRASFAKAYAVRLINSPRILDTFLQSSSEWSTMAQRSLTPRSACFGPCGFCSLRARCRHIGLYSSTSSDILSPRPARRAGGLGRTQP